MLDTLSNRIDYLEKICQKVETASKKHASKRPVPSVKKLPLPENSADTKAAAATPPEDRATATNNKEMDLKKQMAADDSAEKKFSLNSILNKPASSLSGQRGMISIDPSTLESIKSMLNVRNKLKVATIDLMDRVKNAEEGFLKSLQ